MAKRINWANTLEKELEKSAPSFDLTVADYVYAARFIEKLNNSAASHPTAKSVK